MQNSDDINRRLTDLEVKASFADDLLDQLNQTIFRQQEQIERLARQLGELRKNMPDPTPGTARDLREDLPPHY